MREATAWNEVVSFFECPICGDGTELGSDMVFDKEPEETQCGGCGGKFMLWPPGHAGEERAP